MNTLASAAEWIAPIATMIAAMMTAANLGARLTGWGFIVFTVGSICWALIGATNGQTNLLATNGFLTIVNLVGIWRWLGRQAKYEAGAQRATDQSEHLAGPSLVAASSLATKAVKDAKGQEIGHCIEAMIDRQSGRIDYLVVASTNAAGLDEELRAVPLADCCLTADAIVVRSSADIFFDLPILVDGKWPGRVEGKRHNGR